MQLLESSPLGLRMARIALVSPDSATTVTLFPMVHIGDVEFFDAVYEDAFAHEICLVEGINSPIVRRITRSYRWIVGAPRLALRIQPPYPRGADVRAHIVLADLSAGEFTKVWRRVPIWLRALVNVVAPIIGLWYRWFGTREALAHGLTFEDLPRREETLSWNPEMAALTTAVLDARDQRLVSALGEQLERMDGQFGRLAILYGAGHMRAVLRELSRRGYHANDSKWFTAFTL